MKKAVLKMSLAAMAAVTVLLIGAKPVQATEIVDIERDINDIRVASGRCELVSDPKLVEAANIRAREAAQYWSHTRPDGRAFNTVSKYAYGENLAYTEAETAADIANVVPAWMASPSHKDNLLYTGFRTTGIGYYLDNGTMYVCQLFGY